MLTDRMAEAIMKSIVEAGHVVMKNPRDYEARATLMWGASLAHNNLLSCGRLKGSGIHLIEEELHAANGRIVHGVGLSAIFPSYARQVYKRNIKRFARFAVEVFNENYDYEHPEKTALKGIEDMEELIDFLGLPKTLKEIGVSRDQFDMVAEHCTENGRKVSNLCPMTKEDVLEILERAAE